MNFRALLRRAFPYMVIGVGGFALAYVVISVFVFPTETTPPTPQLHATDSSSVAATPIDTGIAPAGNAIEPPPTEPAEPSPVPARVIPRTEAEQPPVPAPNLVGMSLADASAILDSFHLRIITTRDTSSFDPPNTVLRQYPAPDAPVRAGGAVTLTISYFPPDSTSDTMRVQRGDGQAFTTPAPTSLRQPDLPSQE